GSETATGDDQAPLSLLRWLCTTAPPLTMTSWRLQSPSIAPLGDCPESPVATGGSKRVVSVNADTITPRRCTTAPPTGLLQATWTSSQRAAIVGSDAHTPS